MNEQTTLTPTDETARDEASLAQRGRMVLASCRAADATTDAIAACHRELTARPDNQAALTRLKAIDFSFADGEQCVRLPEDVRQADVFLFQNLVNPNVAGTVDDHYMAFFLAARTLREWGAAQVVGVLPYLAYARQDKGTTGEREPASAALMAELTAAAGVDSLVTWHPHTTDLRDFYGIPFHGLDPVDSLLHRLDGFANDDEVILVAPDVGARELVRRCAELLGLPCAFATKTRAGADQVTVSGLDGDFTGRRVAVLVDDIISSGATLLRVMEKLVAEHDIRETHVAVSHNLCRPAALDNLSRARREFCLRSVSTADSIPPTDVFRQQDYITIVGLAETLARVANHIHCT